MNIMKMLRIVARLLIGVFFIFSGYVKVIDPIGSAIKFGEYFEAFSMHFLIPTSLVFGILLAVAELGLGLCMLFGVRMKEASWGALLFMLFFTGLTFVLAVFNPVEDCGCFGDAIKLTNWQTFFKNLIILPFVLFIFFQRKLYRPFVCCKVEWAIATGVVLFSLGLSIYSYRHLPLIDFMAYKVGVNIPEAMAMPEDAPLPVYDNTFIYEKGGVKQEFKIDNLPDSTWTFVDTKTKLISQGYVPPAKDFTITNINNEYVTDSVLTLSGYMIFITSDNINNANLKNIERINTLAAYSKQNNIHLMLLSGSFHDDNVKFTGQMSTDYPTFHTDETVLKSMVRSNPGMMLLKDATILKKWNNNDLPTVAELEKLLSANPTDIISQHKACERNTTIILGLAVLFVFSIIIGYTRFKQKKN